MAKIAVKFQNAHYSGYGYSLSKAPVKIDSRLPITYLNTLPDLEINRQDTDLSLLHNRCLLSINGLFQTTLLSNNRLWVLDGARAMVRSSTNHIGIMSFMAYNDPPKKFPITADMISIVPGFPLYEKMYITAPEAITTLALVVGGYLQLEEPTVLYRVSPTAFVLCLDQLPYIERLFELYRYTDIFTQLNLTVTAGNINNMIDIALATNNEHITSFMTLKTSFMVSVPASNLTKEIKYFSQTTRPGVFNSSTEPTDGLFSITGKNIEYFKTKVDTGWESFVTDRWYENHILTSLPNTTVGWFNLSQPFQKDVKLVSVNFQSLTSEV